MKNVTRLSTYVKTLIALIMLSFSQTLVLAQDKKVDIDISTDSGGGGDWYTRPWVWIVGGAIFLLLLVALLRGGGRRDA
jgi:hypothetical protein